MFFAALLVSSSALAWGPIGHRVVGEIAQRRLKPDAAKTVASILGQQSLPDVANWADLMRSDPAWKRATPWHYVSIEDNKQYRDVPPVKEGDVIWAVENFQEVLKRKSSTLQEKREALSFLVHFIGDLHQPLHVGRKADLGGNTIRLKWFGSRTNLHEVWDDKMIEMEELSYTEYASMLERTVKLEAAWETDTLLNWVSESQGMRSQVYDFPKEPTRGWEYEYRFKNAPQMHQRLLQAGVRLAALLNRILL